MKKEIVFHRLTGSQVKLDLAADPVIEGARVGVELIRGGPLDVDGLPVNKVTVVSDGSSIEITGDDLQARVGVFIIQTTSNGYSISDVTFS